MCINIYWNKYIESFGLIIIVGFAWRGMDVTVPKGHSEVIISVYVV